MHLSAFIITCMNVDCLFKLEVPSASQGLEDFEVSGSKRTVDTVVILIPIILGIIVIIIAGTIVSVVLLTRKG